MYGGAYNNWPGTWTPLTSLNDPIDTFTPHYDRLDFVGDSADPCAY